MRIPKQLSLKALKVCLQNANFQGFNLTIVELDTPSYILRGFLVNFNE